MYISPMIWLVLSLAHFIFGSGYAADPSAGKPVPIGVFSRFSVSTMTATWKLASWNETSTFSPDEQLWNNALAYAHAFVCIYFCVVSIGCIQQAHSESLDYRWKSLGAMVPPRATTLFVEGIPREQRSDESLYAYFARLFSKEAAQRAYIIRRTWVEPPSRQVCAVMPHACARGYPLHQGILGKPYKCTAKEAMLGQRDKVDTAFTDVCEKGSKLATM